jgi:hypothetical protein
VAEQDLAEVMGFGKMFPEPVAEKKGDDSPAGESQDTGEEPKKEEAPQEVQSEEDAPPEAATEEGGKDEPEDAGKSEEEGEELEEGKVGRRAEKRIKQLSARAKAAEDKSRALELEMAQLRGRVDQIAVQPKPETKEDGKKTWSDLSLDEVDYIVDHHPEHADRARKARSEIIARMVKDEASRVAKEFDSKLTERDRRAAAAQQAQTLYPEVAAPGSALRVLAEKVYLESGIPEIGLTPADIQANPLGVLIATKEAFSRLALERNGAVSKPTPVKAKDKENGRLETGRRPAPAPKTKVEGERKKVLTDYVNGKIKLADVLAARGVGDGLPVS